MARSTAGKGHREKAAAKLPHEKGILALSYVHAQPQAVAAAADALSIIPPSRRRVCGAAVFPCGGAAPMAESTFASRSAADGSCGREGGAAQAALRPATPQLARGPRWGWLY